VSVVDTKAEEAKTSGEQNARTVVDVQDEASTDNGGALAVGIISLLIGVAAVAVAIFVVVRKNKSKADNKSKSNQQVRRQMVSFRPTGCLTRLILDRPIRPCPWI
jgi:hypothetical protein